MLCKLNFLWYSLDRNQSRIGIYIGIQGNWNMLAENLKKVRRSKGYSQDEVASRLNITRQSLSKWENGHAYPDILCLKALCELYEVSIDKMVADDSYIEEKEEKSSKTDAEYGKEHFWHNEGIFMIMMIVASCLIPFLGVPVSLCCLLNLKKQKIYSFKIKLIVIFALILSLINSFIILNNLYFHIGEATIL